MKEKGIMRMGLVEVGRKKVALKLMIEIRIINMSKCFMHRKHCSGALARVTQLVERCPVY